MTGVDLPLPATFLQGAFKFGGYEFFKQQCIDKFGYEAASRTDLLFTPLLLPPRIAGFSAALISQPADTLLSKINKAKGQPGQSTMSRLFGIGKELGLRGAFAGIVARLFLVGTLTAFQFAIYGDIKKMAAYLDPDSRAFADAAAKGQPLYEKSYQEARDILEGIQNYKPAADIQLQEVKIPVNGEDVTTVIFRPAKAQGTLPLIFYTHGGGWILGSPTVHGSLVEDFVRQTGAAVVFPYYTPAPEAQYPTQFEQSYGVLEHVIKNGDKYNLKVDKFGLAGDSVGGHMAIALAQLSQQRSLPSKIAHIILLYPVTDTHKKSPTYKTFQNGPYLAEKTMDWMIAAFLPNEEDRRLPLTSPLEFAPDEVLAKFPPTTVFVSGADPLIGEGEAFGHRLQGLGVDAAVLKADGQIHDFALLEPVRKAPTARAVVELASLKLRKAISE
ncbi:hypothetical protein ACJ41O_005493 [Fusarium nematophilum]